MTLNRTPERGHLSLAVIPRRLGGLLSRHFSCLLAPRDRTRISASAACGEAREWVKQANRPAGERQRSSVDHPCCGSSTGPSSHMGAAQ